MSRFLTAIVLSGLALLLAAPPVEAQMRGRLLRRGNDRGYQNAYYGNYGYSTYSDAGYGWTGRRNYQPYYGGYGYSNPQWGGYNNLQGAGYSQDYPAQGTVQPAMAIEGQPLDGISISGYRPVVGDRAMVRIVVGRPNAQLWIQDQQMPQVGPQRLFVSPPLEQGFSYMYKIKATWMGQDGKEVTREKEVQFKPGQQVVVNLSDRQETMPGGVREPIHRHPQPAPPQ